MRTKIGVIGCGKLGLPLCLVLAKHFDVIGYDIIPERIRQIEQKAFAGYKEKHLMEYLEKYKFKATNEAYRMQDREIMFCIVNTPSKPLAFSNQHIINAIRDLKPYMGKLELFVVVSTIMPNSHQDIQDELGNIPICYNPEFIALGNVIEGIEKPDFVLIGEQNKQAGNKLEAIYRKITNSPIERMDLTSAEVTKIALNAYVTMKISYANMIGEVAEKSGANGDLICKALGHDKRIGSKYLKPGAMYQGPCFPRDNRAFNYFLKDIGISKNYCQITDDINEHQLERVENKIRRKLISINGKKISLIGMNYKVDSEETTESMGLKLNHLLKERGAITEIDTISDDSDLVIYCMPDKRELFSTEKEILDLWK